MAYEGFKFVNLRAAVVETDEVNIHDLVLRPDGSVWQAVNEEYQTFDRTMMTLVCQWPIPGDTDSVSKKGPHNTLKIANVVGASS